MMRRVMLLAINRELGIYSTSLMLLIYKRGLRLTTIGNSSKASKQLTQRLMLAVD